jgi:hypothetical protein
MRTYKDAKAMAKSLRDSLATRRVLFSHSECLEIVARQLGFADWNTLSPELVVESGRLRPEKPKSGSQPAILDGTCQMPRTAEPEQVSCSFCNKSQREVRGLIEGGCRRNRGGSPCVFICDECVAVCTQINIEIVGNAPSQERLAIR